MLRGRVILLVEVTHFEDKVRVVDEISGGVHLVEQDGSAVVIVSDQPGPSLPVRHAKVGLEVIGQSVFSLNVFFSISRDASLMARCVTATIVKVVGLEGLPSDFKKKRPDDKRVMVAGAN
jgi:hypothetical protein